MASFLRKKRGYIIMLEVSEILKKFQRSKKDTGSSEVQIALLTAHINHLTEHLKIHKKDEHSRFGLRNMVSQRRRLMKYFKRRDLSKYNSVIQELGLRDQ
jgi:small subunit ribosomal protein S15